ncbi:MAG: GreA/GreB family elongation factor [Patescibacteria group bacterium]|nr:GreA/GreB family elongation factor [Patescibacteria group bacterium]
MIAILKEELTTVMNAYERNRLEIKKAAENGFNISAALEEEKIWEAKIKSIKDLIKNKQAVPFKRGSRSVVLGSQVTTNSHGKRRTFIIDGVGYQNKLLTIISCESPVGSALMGKKITDLVKVKGQLIKIESICDAW